MTGPRGVGGLGGFGWRRGLGEPVAVRRGGVGGRPTACQRGVGHGPWL